MSAETISDVPIITSETIDFPAGGASVRVKSGVSVVAGKDHGDVAGRAFIVSQNGDGMMPEVSKPTYTPRAVVEIMNA